MMGKEKPNNCLTVKHKKQTIYNISYTEKKERVIITIITSKRREKRRRRKTKVNNTVINSLR